MQERGGKRGSHIDVILSFVIFISFIVFLYAMVQPNLTVRESKTAFLSYMGNELIRNMTGTDLARISTKVDFIGDLPQGCVELVNFFAETGVSPTVIVKNSSGGTQTSYYTDNSLYLYNLPSLGADYLFSIFYSPDFPSISSGGGDECMDLAFDAGANFYSISQFENYSSYNYVWSGNIGNMIEIYNNEYQAMKSDFGLSSLNNFRFDFTYQNGTVAGTEDNIPESINVYSELFPVIYLSENGGLEAGNLIVSIW